MTPRKAVRDANGRIRVVKAKKAKKPPKKNIYDVSRKIIAETLQNNSDGVFDLPSGLVRYNDPKDPRYRLGLHRETWIPKRPMPFFRPESETAQVIYNNDASLIIAALDSFPIKYKDFDLEYCDDCS